MFENITLEIYGKGAILTINRPKARNALNPETLVEISDALTEAAEEEVSYLIITGSGEKAFVAGADISVMEKLTPIEAEDFALLGQSVFNGIEEFPAPVIAAVNGFALGGGTELAISCDIILAAKNAVFGQPEVKLGVIPGFGGTQRLSRLVSPMRAKEIIYTGRMVDAYEAEKIGLTLKVVDDVLSVAKELGEQIAQQGPVAVRFAKRAITENQNVPLSVGLAAERTLFAMLFSTKDQSEGMEAFLQKRIPDFKGE